MKILCCLKRLNAREVFQPTHGTISNKYSGYLSKLIELYDILRKIPLAAEQPTEKKDLAGLPPTLPQSGPLSDTGAPHLCQQNQVLNPIVGG